MTDEGISQLAQKLYEEDGHAGNIYKKAPIRSLSYYEHKAEEILMDKTEQERLVADKVMRIIRQSYINGYNAKCRGETWEQDDGTVITPERLILLDALEIARIPELAILHPDQELPEYPYPLISRIAGEMEIVDTWQKIHRETQQDMLKEGWRRIIKGE